MSTCFKKPKCSDLGCREVSSYYCYSHQMFSCKECNGRIHFRCQIAVLREIDEIKDSIKEAERLIMMIEELSIANGCSMYIPKIENTLVNFKDILYGLSKKVTEVVDNWSPEDYSYLEGQLREIQSEIADNPDIKEVLFLSISKEASLNPFATVENEYSSNSKIQTKIDSILQKHTKFLTQRHKNEMAAYKQHCKTQILEEFHTQISTLKTLTETQTLEISEYTETIKALTLQNQELSLELQAQVSKYQDLELETAKLREEFLISKTDLASITHKFTSSENQHKKALQNIQQLEEKLEELKLEAIRNIEGFDPSCTKVELLINQDKGKAIIKTLASFRYQFEPLERLKISNFKDEDESVNDFLTYCSPPSLNLLFFGVGIGNPVNINYYLDGLKCLLPQVYKEIFLLFFILDEENFSRIVRLSSNCSRLVFSCCKISTSLPLDFSNESTYRTEYLSLQWCGSQKWHTNMNWMKKPKYFENILTAIKNSTLKDSLQILNAAFCNIKIQEAKKLLDKHGLTSINVVSLNTYELIE
ncbi:unnamed protein product [Moneuplotes crassus]|uniref:Uncharacterized protein n=1 Tax=Euplotes crassus TaxID=5936 RepID=A0AAD1U6L7_EUPCR|nr:unnamed protein product [Moneuplotes crassus]